jgi:hypothetical protein
MVNERMPPRVFGIVIFAKHAMYNWLNENVEPCSEPPVIRALASSSAEWIKQQSDRSLQLHCWASILNETLKKHGEPELSYIRDRTCFSLVYHRSESTKWEYFECFYKVAEIEYRQTIVVVQDELNAIQMKLSVR